MTLTQLRYFVAVVQHGSINAAANACYISYNAMYKSILSLEKELNFTLLHRTPNGISLTLEGTQFYQDAIIITKLASTWDTLALRQNTAQHPLLKVHCNHFFVFTNCLISLSDTLAEKNIFFDYFSCHANTVRDILSQLKTEEDDTIFLTQSDAQKNDLHQLAKQYNYEVRYLCSDYCKVYLHKNKVLEEQSSITLDELEFLTPIVFSNEFPKWVSFDANIIYDFNKPHFLASSPQEAFQKIRSRPNCYCILRSKIFDYMSTSDLQDITALDIEDYFTGTNYYVLYPKKLSPTGKSFLQELEEYCQMHYSTMPYNI